MIAPEFVDQIGEQLAANKRVRRKLPLWGRVHIDRQLPFLCVYRRPTRRSDPGTEHLVMSQPSYIIASAQKSLGLPALVQRIAAEMEAVFGGFLLVELWSLPEETSTEPLQSPAFRLLVPDGLPATVQALENALSRIEIGGLWASVEIETGVRPVPARFPSLLNGDQPTIGIGVKPIYRMNGMLLPLVHQALIEEMNRVFQRAFFLFARTQTRMHPPHFHVLGRRAVVKAVWEIDRQLTEIDSSFDFLLQTTPINTAAAWRSFRRSKFERPPTLYYRPHPIDPAALKRELWNIDVERVEDPTLQNLFREKRVELDTQLSMLASINTPRFFYGSMQLYGDLDDTLVSAAVDLLRTISPRSRDVDARNTLDTHTFIGYARDEIARYRQERPDFAAQVYERDNVTGMMVSSGDLLVGKDLRIPRSRAAALLSHEIGVHIVTYYNGRAQPLKLLQHGLSGYDELQEGLAVLAEYLVGGLSKPRLRLLAGRVVAAHSLINGATFVDTYRLLNRTYGFNQRTAFGITVRTHRAGGLTKDAVYLRGLIKVLLHLGQTALHECLFIGKIALEHIPIVQELQRRQVLQAPAVIPHFLQTPQTQSRLDLLSGGLRVNDLVQ